MKQDADCKPSLYYRVAIGNPRMYELMQRSDLPLLLALSYATTFGEDVRRDVLRGLVTIIIAKRKAGK